MTSTADDLWQTWHDDVTAPRGLTVVPNRIPNPAPDPVAHRPVAPVMKEPASPEPVEALMPSAPARASAASYAAAAVMTAAAAAVLGLYVGVPLVATMVALIDGAGTALAVSALVAAVVSLSVVLILRATLSRISPFPGRHAA